MTQRSVAVALFGWTVLTSHVLQGPAASAGSQSQGGRAADLAAIEKFRQQDIAATLSRDPVALPAHIKRRDTRGISPFKYCTEP
jgi:hypothetical protein